MHAIRARRPLDTTEVPASPSRIIAPAGLFWTPQERAAPATAGAGGGRFTREREPTRMGGEP